MFTYVKLDQYPQFIDFEEMFDEDLYNNLGDTYEDFLENKWVMLNEEQQQFHTDNEKASVKEVMEMQIDETRVLEEAKQKMYDRIHTYDVSDDVNSFLINGEVSAWLTPTERSNYRSSIDAAELAGLESISFYVNDIFVTLPIQTAKLMLAQIQLYADQCFIVTKQHRLQVQNMETVEDVEQFDYTAGYPEKINFTIDL